MSLTPAQSRLREEVMSRPAYKRSVATDPDDFPLIAKNVLSTDVSYIPLKQCIAEVIKDEGCTPETAIISVLAPVHS